MSLKKNVADASNEQPSKAPKTKTSKAKPETVVPDGLVVQVHERQIPPEGYRICNGTTFGTYQPKPWGR